MKCLAIKDLGNGVLGHSCYIAVILKIQEEFTCENISEVFHVWSFLNNWVVRDSISYRSGPLPRHAFASEIERVDYSRRIRMVIACSWVSSFTSISIDVLFNFQFGEIILLCIGYSSLLVLTIVYIKLFSVARHHAASTHSQSEVPTHMSITSMAQKETQPSKFSMYTSFPCCVTIPSISLRRFWLITSNPDVRNQAAIHVTAIVIMLNSSLNPIVFGWKMKEICQIVKYYFITN